MKTNSKRVILATCAALAISTGCGEKEEPASSSLAQDTPTAAEAGQQPAATENAPREDLAQPAAATSQEEGRIQDMIDAAKNLTDREKYAQALQIIAQLSKQTLSPEQQALVDELKKTAEQETTKSAGDQAVGDAASDLGGGLGPNE